MIYGLSGGWAPGSIWGGYERAFNAAGDKSEIYSTLYLEGVSAVPVIQNPVPAAVWLFGTALIGFIGFARRTSVT